MANTKFKNYRDRLKKDLVGQDYRFEDINWDSWASEFRLCSYLDELREKMETDKSDTGETLLKIVDDTIAVHKRMEALEEQMAASQKAIDALERRMNPAHKADTNTDTSLPPEPISCVLCGSSASWMRVPYRYQYYCTSKSCNCAGPAEHTQVQALHSWNRMNPTHEIKDKS